MKGRVKDRVKGRGKGRVKGEVDFSIAWSRESKTPSQVRSCPAVAVVTGQSQSSFSSIIEKFLTFAKSPYTAATAGISRIEAAYPTTYPTASMMYGPVCMRP